MSSTEERARAAMRAIAATVRDAPPIQFTPAPEPSRAAGQAKRAGNGPDRPGAPRAGWRWWLAPLTAAAVVIALAIALVIVKDLPNGGAVPVSPAQPAAGPGGAPRYFAALRVKVTASPGASDPQAALIVGDSLTGKTLATFRPPPGTTFQSVSAAADDRTFVVFAVSSSTGSFLPANGTLTGSWYEVRLAPGTATPASLRRLPVKPMSWTASPDVYTNPPPGQVYATALSASGREIAVADIPDIPAARAKPQDWQEVKVFSVATGRLLHDWTGYDPGARLMTVVGGTMAGVPTGEPDLTWIDGDRAIALATSLDESNQVTGTVRRLNVTGPASGNLMTDSTVTWSGPLPWGRTAGCFSPGNWPPAISADGKTISCMTFAAQAHGVDVVDFLTQPLTAGATPASKAALDYRLTWPPHRLADGKLSNPGGVAGLLWISPSAGTLVVESVPGGNLSPPKSAYFGVVSHGRYTPLPLPKSLAASEVSDITF